MGDATHTSGRGVTKTRDGIVVSNKMDKTVVVSVRRMIRHGKYGKILRRSKKYFAHDKDNTCEPGDLVRIVETRPLSKLKRWKVREILAKAN